MYIQLTNRCNMSCAHCCMDSGPHAHKKDQDMPPDVFLAAVLLAKKHGDYITIGGGEPLLHDKFFDYLDKVIELDLHGSSGIEPLIVTNGKHKTRTWHLIDEYLECDKAIAVDLSQDKYHEPIDSGIVAYFKRADERMKAARYSSMFNSKPYNSSIVSIRNGADRRVLAVGRGANITGASHGCCCETLMVAANGDIFSCGCKKFRLGNVLNDSALDIYKWYNSDYAHTGGLDPHNLPEEMPVIEEMSIAHPIETKPRRRATP